MLELLAVPLLSTLVGVSTPATRIAPEPEVLRAIDALHRAGRLTVEERLRLRVAAFRAPHQLPADLRARLGAAIVAAPSGSATRVFREAWAHVARTETRGGALHRLLQPPDDLAYAVDSDRYPIRVSYDVPSQLAQAQAALAYAESAYDLQIGEYGFYAPPLPVEGDRYRFYLQTAGPGAAGYTAPYESNEQTPWSDCFSYIVIDPENGDGGELADVIAHEISHSLQIAMDCDEIATFMENTSTYIGAQSGAAGEAYLRGMVPYFQSQPWRALDYMKESWSDGYEYGGALWLTFLTDRFAPEAGPVLVREFWEGAMQPGWSNAVTYLESIERTLQTREGTALLDDLIADFSEVRFFVGSDDDGAHLGQAWWFQDGEVARAAVHASASLPLRAQEPPASRRPAPTGSNHVLLQLAAGDRQPLVVDFDGDEDTRWVVRVVRIPADGPAVSEPLTLDATTLAGRAVVDIAGFDRVLLLVVNLGPVGYDPNRREWPVSSYRYGFAFQAPAATLEALYPARVERGQQDLAMRLTGQGFVPGSDFAVSFDDPNLQVTRITSVTATEVKLLLTVPALASLGPKTLVLTNAGGLQTVGTGFLTVAAANVPGGDAGPQPPLDPSGCACQSGRGGGAGGLLLGLLFLLVLRRRRR